MNSIRFFLNIFGSIFIKVRYRKRIDPFAIFSKMIGEGKVTINNNKKFKGTYIIAPVRVSPTSNLFEGLLGYFLKLRGYQVKAIMCDQAVSFCDNLSKNGNYKNVKCALCKKEQDRFCSIFGFEQISIRKSIDDSALSKIEKDIKGRDFTNDSDFIYEGVNLQNDIYSGTLRYTLKSEIKTKEDQEILKKAALTSFLFTKATIKILNEVKPVGVIMSHGIYSTWGAILSTCKHLKMKTIVWGRGYVGQGNIIFAHNKSSHDESIYESNEFWKDHELTDEQKKLTYSYFDKKINRTDKVDYVNYYDNIKSSDFDVPGFYNSLKKYEKIYGMFTNIPWDGQVFNKSEGFPNTNLYITNTIEWFIKNPSCVLVIRAHPAEKSRTNAKGTETFEELLMDQYKILPQNVIFLKPECPISSYELSKHIHVAILFGSTLALEFAVMEIPVLQTGMFNVSGKNIVFECKNKVEFWDYLDKVKEGKLMVTEQMKNNALKYAYYWLYKRHIEDTTVDLKKMEFQNFRFKNMAEFEQNEFLKFVTESIENNTKIITKY